MNNEAGKLDTSNTASLDSTNTLSQLELIKLWRSSLDALMNDIGFKKQARSENDKFESVREDAEYLNKINNLLDETDDFQLSESGFTKYKVKHLQVFETLSNFLEKENTRTDSKFYFTNINKHFEQQLIPTNLQHTQNHLLLIILSCFVFFAMTGAAVFQTQQNIIVYILLCLCVWSQFHVVSELFKMVKDSAATPSNFKISLLSIHLVNTIKRAVVICIIPILLIVMLKPYWIDDIIIISLLMFYFYIRSVQRYFKPVTVESEIENKNV